MAGLYRGVNGINRKILLIYRGVNGVNKDIKEYYRGINGTNRLVFQTGYTIEDIDYMICKYYSNLSDVTVYTYSSNLMYSSYILNNEDFELTINMYIVFKDGVKVPAKSNLFSLFKTKGVSMQYYFNFRGNFSSVYGINNINGAISLSAFGHMIGESAHNDWINSGDISSSNIRVGYATTSIINLSNNSTSKSVIFAKANNNTTAELDFYASSFEFSDGSNTKSIDKVVFEKVDYGHD